MTHAATPARALARALGFSLPSGRFSRRKAKAAAARKSLSAGGAGAGTRTYMVSPGQPVWMERDYGRFALEGYMRNVIAHRSMAMVAGAAASVHVKLFTCDPQGNRVELKAHPLLTLLAHPNPTQTRAAFFEAIYTYRLISGNAFLLAGGPVSTGMAGGIPQELHTLRPDRVAIIAGKGGLPAAFRYTAGGFVQDYPIDPVTWGGRVLHLRQFHPLNDWYGLSPIEAVAYSIDQHNQAGAWNQALLQNGARPSGALVFRGDGQGGQGGTLGEEQYYRLKQQIDEQFSGPVGAGKPILLEGGLDWKELSMTPKDMDFMECKNASARDIALGFGVPPQLLGIPGDNTYSNLVEARLALWEQTVLPMVESTLASLSRWLEPMYGNASLELKPDVSNIVVLATRNQAIWDRMQSAAFLTADEKRAAVGYGPLGGAASTLAPAPAQKSRKYSPGQPRDGHGRWTSEGEENGDGSTQVVESQTTEPAAEVDDSDSVGTTPGGVGYDAKIQKDMVDRGWTPEQIDDAKQYGSSVDAINKTNGEPFTPATRYVNPDTGKSVVIDNATNKVVQVGRSDFEFGVGSGDAPGAVMRPSSDVRPLNAEGGGGGGGTSEDIFHPSSVNPGRQDIEE